MCRFSGDMEYSHRLEMGMLHSFGGDRGYKRTLHGVRIPPSQSRSTTLRLRNRVTFLMLIHSFYTIVVGRMRSVHLTMKSELS